MHVIHLIFINYLSNNMNPKENHPESSSSKRFCVISPGNISRSVKKKIFAVKKRQVNIGCSLKPHILSRGLNSTGNLMQDQSLLNPLNQSVISISDKDFSELKLKFDRFMKKINGQKDEQKLSIELKYYASILSTLGNLIKPFGMMLKMIADNLNKYIEVFDNKSKDDYKMLNDKLMHKLEVLSAENIEFYKKNEELKKELVLLKKTIVYNDAHFAIENLLKELTVKSDYITKCNNEIQEYKIREYDLMRRLESNKELFIRSNKRMSTQGAQNPIVRSQSIMSIPRISLGQNDSSPGLNLENPV